MNYKQLLFKDFKKLNKETQGKFLYIYQQLKREGKDNEWIYLAFSEKDIETWNLYGFGLMFHDNYRKYIDAKYSIHKITSSLEDGSLEELFNSIVDN